MGTPRMKPNSLLRDLLLAGVGLLALYLLLPERADARIIVRTVMPSPRVVVSAGPAPVVVTKIVARHTSPFASGRIRSLVQTAAPCRPLLCQRVRWVPGRWIERPGRLSRWVPGHWRSVR